MKRPGMNESQRKKQQKKPLQNPKLHQQKNHRKEQITLLAAGGKSTANTKKNDHHNDIIKVCVPKYLRSFSNSTELKWCHRFSFQCMPAEEMQRDAAPSNIIDLQHYKNPQSHPQHQQSLRTENPCKQRKWTAVHLKHYNHRRNLHNGDQKKQRKVILHVITAT